MKKLITTGLVLVLWALACEESSPPARRASQPSLASVQADLKTLYDSGLLKELNASMGEALVSRALWEQIEYKTKEGIGLSLAKACGTISGTNRNRVDIKDHLSGKLLAKSGDTYGFKTY